MQQTKSTSISETKWNGSGSFQTDNDNKTIFSGKKCYSHGVIFILPKESTNAVLGYALCKTT